MTANSNSIEIFSMLEGWIKIILTLGIIVAIAPILGNYIARVYLGQTTVLDSIIMPIDRLIFKAIGIQSKSDMTGWQYARAVLSSNLIMAVLLFLMIMLQGLLLLNPTGLDAPSWHLALHTTISFITNTNQQHYSGETTLSYFTQMLGLGFLFFTSAATGLAVAIAFIRGLTGKPLGNFYVDLTQAITRILLPLSFVGAIALMIAGTPETLAAPVVVPTLENPNLSQAIALGPIAHFEIIKELGENGGVFFGINSAHPFENPNGFTNLIQIVAMMAIPTSLIFTYGTIANNRRQATLIFGMVFILYVAGTSANILGIYLGCCV